MTEYHGYILISDKTKEPIKDSISETIKVYPTVEFALIDANKAFSRMYAQKVKIQIELIETV